MKVYYTRKRFAFLPTKITNGRTTWLRSYYDVVFYHETEQVEILQIVARTLEEHVAHLLAKNWEKWL